jgi:Flp pilus assembly pilin Flp
MLLKVKGQSTVEYAILIALVSAVAVGFLSVGLKGAIRGKNQQASDYLMKAGNDANSGSDLLAGYGDTNEVPLYTQEVSKTQVKGGDEYKSIEIMEQGGAEKKLQLQTTESAAVSVETLEGNNP